MTNTGMTNTGAMSPAFRSFIAETPDHARAWLAAADGLGTATALDPKTRHLAYLSVLAAMRLEDGLAFHVGLAKAAGAPRDEVASAILLGLPAAGNAVVHALPGALAAWDAG